MSTETPDLDNKKDESNTTTKVGDIGGFFKWISISIALIIAYFVSSGLILYACKLAQSNILPTDKNCWPYTNQNVEISQVTTNIFTSSPFDDVKTSMKINFPYNDKNKKNALLDALRNAKYKPKVGYMKMYFMSIIEDLMIFYNSAFNTLLGGMNQYMPEWLIVSLGPVIMCIFSQLILIVGNIYAVILWITNCSWFFKRNQNNDETKPPKSAPDWRSITLDDDGIISYLYSIWLSSLFITIHVILTILVFPVVSIMPSITFLIAIFSGLLYKGEMTAEDNKKTEVNAGTIIFKFIKYYKVCFMAFVSASISLFAFLKLGTFEGIWSIVIAGLILGGILTIDVFKPINRPFMSGWVSDEPATRVPCPKKEEIVDPKSGLFYKITHPQNLFKGGGEKKLVNQLKNLHKIQLKRLV